MQDMPRAPSQVQLNPAAPLSPLARQTAAATTRCHRVARTQFHGRPSLPPRQVELLAMEEAAKKAKGELVGMSKFCGGEMSWATVRLECLCGITVALAQVPEAVAFSFVAGVEPTVGLTAAWIMGVITALFGGRPAMISGATGAIAAVTSTLVAEHGVEYLLLAIVLTGVMQIVAGAARAGKLVRMIPHPVMMGFCNGLALVIGLAQFTSFKRAPSSAERRVLSGAFGVVSHRGRRTRTWPSPLPPPRPTRPPEQPDPAPRRTASLRTPTTPALPLPRAPHRTSSRRVGGSRAARPRGRP